MNTMNICRNFRQLRIDLNNHKRLHLFDYNLCTTVINDCYRPHPKDEGR